MKQMQALAGVLALAIALVAGAPFAAGSEVDFDPEAVLRAMERSRREVAEKMEAATVFIIAEGDSGFSTGTGFFVAPGHILTNHHVVVEGVVGDVHVFNKFFEPTPATVVNHLTPDSDFNGDLALLKVEGDRFADWPYLTFAETVRQTDRVSAWGYPSLVLQHDQRFRELSREAPPVVYSEGSVSALISNPHSQVMHTAVISGGNSGGPLVNPKGEVVGINTYITSTANAAVTMGGALGLEPILSFLYASGVDTVVSSEVIPADVKKALDLVGKLEKRNELDVDNNIHHALAVITVASWLIPDAEAFFILGSAYAGEEEEVEQDLPLARKYLTRAAELGHQEAVELLPEFMEEHGSFFDEETEELAEAEEDDEDEDFNHGLEAWSLYYGMNDKERDFNAALEHDTIAAEEGSALGKAVLSILHYDGYVVKENFSRARRLAKEASDEGEPMGTGMLSVIYYFGNGVRRDVDRARELAEEAAEAGDPLGEYILGRILFESEGEERDLVRAWVMLTRAGVMVQFDLETFLPEVEDEMTRRQLREAKELYDKLIEEWDAEAE